jgi:hypothetical protein
MRQFLRAAAVAAAVALVAVPTGAYALMIAFKPAAQRAISADVVVVGKVATVGKEDVEVLAPFPGAKNKMKYKVATVKITEGLAGADKMKEIKVGFVPPVKPDPKAKGPGVGIRPIPPRGGFGMPELKEGQELLLFLTKHPNGDFYIIPGMSPPVELTNDNAKKELEAVKKITAALADPMKGLKSDKPEVRAETAAAMVMKYRAYPDFGGEVDQVAVNADESKLILKGLAEGEWSNNFRGPNTATGLSAMQAFYSLGLTVKDGWVQPQIAPQPPGAPPIDFGAVMKDAYVKWLDGPGKNYVIKKVVPKKADK